MLSKNNHLGKQQHEITCIKRYTLRKLNIGVCSVLVGLSIGGIRAHADQQKTDQNAVSSENTDQVQATKLQDSQVVLGQHSDAPTNSQSQPAGTTNNENTDQHQPAAVNTDQQASPAVTLATTDSPTTTQDQVNVSDWDYQRQSDGILINGFHGTIQDGKIIVPNSYDFTQAGIITSGQKVYLGAYFRKNTGNNGHDIHDQYGSQATEFMISHNGNGKVFAQGDWGDAFNGVPYKVMDLTNLDVSGVTSMSQMFAWAQCEKIIGLDNWDTSHVGNMGTMFSHCLNLTSVGDLSNWQVGNVTYMADMFALSPKIATVGHLNNWDVRKVNSMVEMFWGCNSLQDIGDLSAWRLDSVQNTRQMFEGCYVLANLGNLDNWGMAQDTDMQGMFNDCRKLTNVGSLDQWQTGRVTNMKNMFNNCYGLTDIGTLANWQTGNVTDMENMFHETTSLKQLNLSNWDTGKVKSLKQFIACENDNQTLTSIGDLSHWNVGNVTNLESAFSHRTKITSLGDLKNWDVSQVTDMQTTFYRMTGLQSLGNLGNWNTGQLTNMIMTFMDDHSLSGLGDIHKWNVANVTAANAAFCRTGMTSIDIHGWNLAHDTDTRWMFAYGLKPTVIDMRGVTLPTSTAFTILSFYGDQPMVVYSDQGSQLFSLNNDHYVDNDWVGNVAIDVVGRHNTNYLTLTNAANNEQIATIPVDFVYTGPEQLVSTLKAATAKAPINQLVQNKYGRTISAANDNFDSDGSLIHNYQPAANNPVALVAGVGSVYPVTLQGAEYTQRIIYLDGTTQVGETSITGHLDSDNKATITAETLNDKIAQGMPSGYYMTSNPLTTVTTINSATPDPIEVQVSNRAQVDVKYETADGTLVKTDTVNGHVGDSATLTFTAPAGYQLADDQASSQSVTFNRTNDPVIVHVTALPVNASVDVKYETADGTVVKTDTVDGHVGDSTTLTFAAPNGYQLAQGQATSQAFTFNETNGPVIVKVVTVPVSASVEVKYETTDGNVVKTDIFHGYVGDQVHLNFVAPAGYEIVGQLPADTYTFTGNDQPIVIEVQATPVTPDHGDHSQPETPTTPTDHGQQNQQEHQTPTKPTHQAGTNEGNGATSQLTSGQTNAKATNNKQADKLPQTGAHRQLSLMALGGLAIMTALGLGLPGKNRRHE